MTSDQVLRAQQGDRDAFADLVRAGYDRLFAAAYRITRDREAAEDAVQDAMVRCWRDIRGLRDLDRFEAWLYRLLVNACRDQARLARRRPVMIFGEPTQHPSGTDPFAGMAERDALERAFIKLPADQRIALVLAHYVGYSAPEIATILGVPTGTVYSRIHYGARAMRTALAPVSAVTASTTESTR
jgi:RNA polymerase sigma-70 factor (ECF subfamily)